MSRRGLAVRFQGAPTRAMTTAPILIGSVRRERLHDPVPDQTEVGAGLEADGERRDVGNDAIAAGTGSFFRPAADALRQPGAPIVPATGR